MIRKGGINTGYKRKRYKFCGNVRVTLTAGVIDITAQKVFTRGHCHSLALALHELTKWPIYGVDISDGTPGHFVVKTPKGKFLDIEGLHTADTWHNINKNSTRPSTIFKWSSGRRSIYFKPEVKKATPFAKAVLKKYYKKGKYVKQNSTRREG